MFCNVKSIFFPSLGTFMFFEFKTNILYFKQVRHIKNFQYLNDKNEKKKKKCRYQFRITLHMYYTGFYPNKMIIKD